MKPLLPPPETDGELKAAAERSPRILIVRVSAIGDVIHGIPVLCALRKAYRMRFWRGWPKARRAMYSRGTQPLDELVRVPRRWWKLPREVWRMRQKLRRMRFDTALIYNA